MPAPPDGAAPVRPQPVYDALDTASRGLLPDILDNLADGVVVADAQGRFVHFNPAAVRILGVGPLTVTESDWSASYGCFCEDGVTPVPMLELPLSMAIRGQTIYDRVLCIRNTNTSRNAWISVNASPLKDGDGTVCGGIIVFRDVTAQREELDHIRMLSAVVEQTADSVIVTDRDGLIEYVNPAAARISGFLEQELVGRTPRILRSGVHGDDFYQQLWATLDKGEVYRGTIVNRKKNGDLYHSEQTITPIRDASRTIRRFVSVGKDVTELRKAAEQETRLQLARSVQQRLCPSSPPRTCGLDLAGAAFMTNETGGDYFDFITLRDGCTGLVVGDVSGHGFDAALVMAETRAYLRSMAQTSSDPGEILTLVNRVLMSDLEGNQFVTMVVTCLDRRTQTLHWASAGHITGYVLDVSGSVKAELMATGVPLGIFSDATFATATAMDVRVGDMVALVTDGVTEAENAAGGSFGSDRAVAVLQSHQQERAAKIVQRLYRAVRHFSDGVPQADDITVVVCKVDGHSSWRREAHSRPGESA